MLASALATPKTTFPKLIVTVDPASATPTTTESPKRPLTMESAPPMLLMVGVVGASVSPLTVAALSTWPVFPAMSANLPETLI